MYRFIQTIILSSLLLALLSGCHAERLPMKPADPGQELPVEFDLDWSGVAETRGFVDESGTQVKTAFQGGDILHILGTFETKSLLEDGSFEMGETTRYGALQYDGTTRNWKAVEGNQLTWPAIATKGSFKAYFVSGSTGVLTTDTPQLERTLSEITPTTDPLQAETAEPIIYGHAVELKFSHICAWLVLKDMQPMVSETYFFSSDDVKDPLTKETKQFNNAFQLTLGKADGVPTLDFNFVWVPYGEYGTVIAGKAQADKGTDVENNPVTTGYVSYFLEPGYYEKFSLTYPSTTAETYPYMSYDFTSIPEKIGGKDNTEPNLKANTVYTLSVTKSPGVIIQTPPSSGGWDESDNYYKVNVEKFLKSVYNGQTYRENETDILESTPDGTKLLVNVDFQNFNYENFEDSEFKPNVQTSSVFDGDYHYIRNLASPLFRYNYGTVKNIGIKTIGIESDSKDQKDLSDESMNRHGALCMWNRENATIENVRVKDVQMTISVVSELSSESGDGSETHNLGCIVGSNTGTINEVALSGTFTLNIIPNSNNRVNSSVLAGGVAGQCAAQGKIFNVSPLEGVPTISIVNTCEGDFGSFSLGGIVGESSGIISGVILSNISIDNTESAGVASYIGGMAGVLTTTDVTTSGLESCVVGGRVKAGITQPYKLLTSGSYIGGIAGAVLNVPVKDCRSAISVYGAPTADNQNVIYATGGGFGRIRTAEKYAFEDLIAYGSVLSAPSASGENLQNYVGNFAGLAPTEWESSWTKYAINTLVHAFGNIGDIGGYQD